MNLFKQINAWGKKIGRVNYVYRMVTRQVIKRALNRPSKFRLHNGLTLRLPVWSGFSGVVWVTQGNADDGCEVVMELFGDRNGVFIDIGAHFGYWGASMAHVSVMIWAVEPNPICHIDLAHNLSRVPSTIYHSALSDSVGTLEFMADDSAPHSKLVDSDMVLARPGKRITVPVTTVDAIWGSSGCEKIWGVKIDTEGHEAKVIMGASEMLASCRPVVLMEASLESFVLMKPLFNALNYDFAWLEELQYKMPQTLRIAPAAIVERIFKEGMLFAIPREKINMQRVDDLKGRFVVEILNES